MEKFNSKTHEQIPTEQSGGYVRKEAVEHTREAEKMAELASTLKGEGISAQDLLHEEALEEHLVQQRKEAIEKEVAENGRENSRLYWLNALREKELNTREFPSSSASPDLRLVPKRFRDDKDFMLEALDIVPGYSGVFDESLLRFASKKLLDDGDFMLEAIKRNAGFLTYASARLRGDADFVLRAVAEGKIGDIGFYSVSPKLVKNRSFLLQAIKASDGRVTLGSLGDSVKYEQEEEYKKDKEIVAESLKRNADGFNYISFELQSDVEFMAPLIRENPAIIKELFETYDSVSRPGYNAAELRELGHDVWTKAELLSFAVRIVKDNPDAVQYLPKKLKKDISKML